MGSIDTIKISPARLRRQTSVDVNAMWVVPNGKRWVGIHVHDHLVADATVQTRYVMYEHFGNQFTGPVVYPSLSLCFSQDLPASKTHDMLLSEDQSDTDHADFHDTLMTTRNIIGSAEAGDMIKVAHAGLAAGDTQICWIEYYELDVVNR